MKKIILILLILISAKLFIGIYEDDEWGEKRVFIKHRPIWKSFFYSPRGMSDLKLSQMSAKDQIEQKLFDEFIINQH